MGGAAQGATTCVTACPDGGGDAGGECGLIGLVGCGGDAIQLALAGAHVVAIDVDPAKVAMARINARAYGVEHRIESDGGRSSHWHAAGELASGLRWSAAPQVKVRRDEPTCLAAVGK